MNLILQRITADAPFSSFIVLAVFPGICGNGYLATQQSISCDYLGSSIETSLKDCHLKQSCAEMNTQLKTIFCFFYKMSFQQRFQGGSFSILLMCHWLRNKPLGVHWWNDIARCNGFCLSSHDLKWMVCSCIVLIAFFDDIAFQIYY